MGAVSGRIDKYLSARAANAVKNNTGVVTVEALREWLAGNGWPDCLRWGNVGRKTSLEVEEFCLLAVTGGNPYSPDKPTLDAAEREVEAARSDMVAAREKYLATKKAMEDAEERLEALRVSAQFRTGRKRGLSDRDAKILSEVRKGRTFAEIGVDFGITGSAARVAAIRAAREEI